jgi:hypothetical protein
MQAAAIVVGSGRQRIQVQDHPRAARPRHVTVGGEPGDSIVRRRARDRVVDIDEVIGRERRMQGNPEQAALAVRIDVQPDEWRGEQLSVANDANCPLLLGDELTSVQRYGDRGWSAEARHDLLVDEARQQRRCVSDGGGADQQRADQNRSD